MWAVSICRMQHRSSSAIQPMGIGGPVGRCKTKGSAPCNALPLTISSASAYLGLTIGISEDNCRLISRSIRRSIWYHNAVFLPEMTFSNIGT